MATGIPIAVGELIDVPTINSWARGYLRKTTAKAVNSTTSATDLLNGEFTLPAGAMGTTKIVRLTAWGDFLQNAGAPHATPRFELGLASTTILDTGPTLTNNVPDSASRYGWRIMCEIQNLGAANSQQAWFHGVLPFIATGTTTVTGAIGNGGWFVDNYGSGVEARITYDGGATASVDTTASCTLTLKVVNASNSATYETQLIGALCEII